VPVRTIVGVIFLALEIFRLQNGFYGNIKESVSDMLVIVPLNLCFRNADDLDHRGSNNLDIGNDPTEPLRMGSPFLWDHLPYA
jgi:hypothetical protein